MFWRRKTIIAIIGISALAITFSIILIILKKSTRPAQVLQVGAGIRPLCSGHNDCPANWMYCVGGECYSYSVTGWVGKGCNVDKDCGNLMLNCVSGKCQREVGEVGGCRFSQDCVDQYGETNPGRWSCTNGQCIKFATYVEAYWDGEKWVSYSWHFGGSPACILNSDCEPGSFCDEYVCRWRINRDSCRIDDECGVLPSDPNAKYICADAAGQHITTVGATGTCQLIENACDLTALLIRPQLLVDPPCGPGRHCEVRTDIGGSFGWDRMPYCVPDEGTTSVNGQPPAGWTDISCPGGTVIERCSNTTVSQRVRYCSNDPNYATNAIRWNGWQGENRESCTLRGEAWSELSSRSVSSTAPAGFYDTSRCALGSRVVRCSNTYPGQLVSYCDDDMMGTVIHWDNWVGPNGETCGLTGEIIASASAWRGFKPTPKILFRGRSKMTFSEFFRGLWESYRNQ